MIGSNERQLTVLVKKKVNSEERRLGVSIDRMACSLLFSNNILVCSHKQWLKFLKINRCRMGKFIQTCAIIYGWF